MGFTDLMARLSATNERANCTELDLGGAGARGGGGEGLWQRRNTPQPFREENHYAVLPAHSWARILYVNIMYSNIDTYVYIYIYVGVL